MLKLQPAVHHLLALPGIITGDQCDGVAVVEVDGFDKATMVFFYDNPLNLFIPQIWGMPDNLLQHRFDVSDNMVMTLARQFGNFLAGHRGAGIW